MRRRGIVEAGLVTSKGENEKEDDYENELEVDQPSLASACPHAPSWLFDLASGGEDTGPPRKAALPARRTFDNPVARHFAAGMSTAEPILRRANATDGEAVRSLVFGVLREFGLATDAHTDADLDDLEGHYFKRGGEFFVLTSPDQTVIGCVGLYRVDDTTIELRKMYLAAAWRGHGLGRRLLEHALARARVLGARKVTLETAEVLQTALALYRRAGFQPRCGGVHSGRCDLAMELILT